MRMMGTLVVGAGLVVLAGASAQADCGPMVLTSIPDTRMVAFADLDGSGGTSPGDKRSGEYALAGADGAPAGKIYWTATPTAVDDAGKATSMESHTVIVLEDGALFGGTVAQPAAAHDDTGPTVMATGHQPVIHGGTGAYAGARGTIAITVDGVDFTYEVDIACE